MIREEKLEYNGIEFNNFTTDPKNFYLWTDTPESNSKPQIKSSTTERGNSHGSIPGKAFYGGRQLEVSGEIICIDSTKTEEENQEKRYVMQKNLEKALALPRRYINNDDGFYEIKWTDEGNNVYVNRARILSPLTFQHENGEPQFRYFQFVLELEKEYWQSETTNEQNVNELEQRTNFTIAEPGFELVEGEFELYFTAYTALVNSGNHDVAPYVIIYGECENPILRNLTTGDIFQVIVNLASEEELHLDFENGLFRKKSGGVYSDISINITAESQTLYLQAGTNETKLEDDIGGANFYSKFIWKNAHV
ncbi:MAG: hypothetical protein ACOCUT_01865 [bacterium]